MVQSLDVEALLRWRDWSVIALAAARREIDDLNVFPIADGDTGSNLYATLSTPIGVDAALHRDTTLAAVAQAIAEAALLGARGSSGVILSQLLRGLCESCVDASRGCAGRSFASALTRGVDAAYAAVSRPVEGTMLTVARAAAVAAVAAASDELAVVVGAALDAAQRSLAATPTQLDVLAAAGVVDAGGRGVVVLFQVLAAVIEEGPMPTFDSPSRHVTRRRAVPGPSTTLHEVMYLLRADDELVPALRAVLDAIGEAVVISGGTGRWNVHVHTADPEAAVSAGRAVGALDAVVIDSLGEVSGVSVVAMAADAAALAARDVIADAGGVLVSAAGPDLSFDPLPGDATLVLAVGSDAAAWMRGSYPDQLVVQVESVVGVLAALAVHDRHQAVAVDAAAMAAAAAATRPAAFDAADAADHLEGLLTESSELLTLIAGSPAVTSELAALARARHPDLVIEVSVAPDLGSTVLIGVE